MGGLRQWSTRGLFRHPTSAQRTAGYCGRGSRVSANRCPSTPFSQDARWRDFYAVGDLPDRFRPNPEHVENSATRVSGARHTATTLIKRDVVITLTSFTLSIHYPLQCWLLRLAVTLSASSALAAASVPQIVSADTARQCDTALRAARQVTTRVGLTSPLTCSAGMYTKSISRPC